MDEEKKEIRQLLIFKRNEIVFDVTNRLHIIQKQVSAESPETRAIIDDIDDEHNIDEATRTMNLAYQECVDHLYSLTKVPVECDGSLDNTYGEPSKYTMAMKLPEDFSKGTVALLKNLIHEYIVSRVITEWLRLTFPSLADMWAAKSDEAKKKIGDAASKRIKPRERPYYMY